MTSTSRSPPRFERQASETPSVGSSTFSTFKEKMARTLSPNRDAHSSNNLRIGERRQSFGTGATEGKKRS
ncbi:uncharacterized protein L201_001645 [Kwoniella dendrophila CBS 6074]|uniref:Uncharacterized protein n=1 Tax=Kwoniella dendrophila CBS 6074 TaxID=1295534 RepID=A0AAX4JNW3_9TREE